MKKIIIVSLTLLLTLSTSLLCGCSQDSAKTSDKVKATELSTAIVEENIDDSEYFEEVEDSSTIGKIDIISYDNNEILESDSTDNDETEKIMLILDTVNYLEDTSDEPDELPKYVLHFIDENDSKYDIWYNLYIYNENLYVQVDTAKTEDIASKPDAEIRLNSRITPKEFEKILKK